MRRRIVLYSLVVALSQCAAAVADENSSVGSQVVAFCKEHRGQQVGSGQCAALAAKALRAVGGKVRSGPDDPNPGDYVWGELIYRVEREGKKLKTTGKSKDIRPGDIIQFRNAKWSGSVNGGYYIKAFPHHTAVVASIEKNGKEVHVYHQNVGGKQFVVEGKLTLTTLREGWLRIYRPVSDPSAENRASLNEAINDQSDKPE